MNGSTMSSLPPARPAGFVLLLAALLLGGCNPEAGAPFWPDDHRARHPISVGRGPVTLDVEVGLQAPGLSPRQRAEVRAFAQTHHQRGEGPIAILIPAGPVAAPVHVVVRDIRDTLSSLGLSSRGIVTVASLPPEAGPDALVRLSFTAHVAQTNACGFWPDKGASDPSNRSYYNFGCASQANLAAQVADPRDLVSPKPSEPAYATRRQTVLEKYGRGEPTATESAEKGPDSTTNVGE